jgi:hypothetical protein
MRHRQVQPKFHPTRTVPNQPTDWLTLISGAPLPPTRLQLDVL